VVARNRTAPTPFRSSQSIIRDQLGRISFARGDGVRSLLLRLVVAEGRHLAADEHATRDEQRNPPAHNYAWFARWSQRLKPSGDDPRPSSDPAFESPYRRWVFWTDAC